MMDFWPLVVISTRLQRKNQCQICLSRVPTLVLPTKLSQTADYQFILIPSWCSHVTCQALLLSCFFFLIVYASGKSFTRELPRVNPQGLFEFSSTFAVLFCIFIFCFQKSSLKTIVSHFWGGAIDRHSFVFVEEERSLADPRRFFFILSTE